MEVLKKIKQFYLSYKTMITFAGAVVLLFLSTLLPPMSYVLMAFILCSYAFANVEESLIYTMFFMFFSGVLSMFIASLAGVVLVMIARYIVDVVRHKVEFFKVPFIITISLVVIGFIVGLFYDKIEIGQGMVTPVLLIMTYIFFAYRKQICARKVADGLLVGMLVSVAAAGFMYFIPACKITIFEWGRIITKGVGKSLFLSDGTYTRLKLMTFHINHLSCFCGFALAYICHLFMNKKDFNVKEKIFYIVSCVFALLIGALTLSKSFIVVCAVIALYMLVYIIKTYKLKSLYVICPVALVGALGCVVLWDKVLHVLSRFVAYDGSFLDMITTGRASIWKNFMSDMFASPLKILFGAGFLHPDVVSIGTHNMYVDILYRVGFVGVCALVALAVYFVKSAGIKLKIDWKKMLPILIILLFAIQEACMDERFLFVLIGAALMFENENKIEKQVEVDYEKQDN